MSVPSGPEDVNIAVEDRVVVRLEPAPQRRDAAAREHPGRVEREPGAMLQFLRFVFARGDRVRDRDAAPGDDRHREPEQHEDPQEQAMHAATSTCSRSRGRS